MANQLGKRYHCAKCGTEVLCTKAGGGTVSCDDQEMEVQEPRPVPSSDKLNLSLPRNRDKNSVLLSG